MGNTRINTTELLSLLDITPADQNVMLVGNHGIGKSEILTEYFSRKGMKVVPLFLGQMSDPGDLIGIPNRNTETGKTEFMPPYWFPLDGKPIVLFLDELNRPDMNVNILFIDEAYYVAKRQLKTADLHYADVMLSLKQQLESFVDSLWDKSIAMSSIKEDYDIAFAAFMERSQLRAQRKQKRAAKRARRYARKGMAKKAF